MQFNKKILIGLLLCILLFIWWDNQKMTESEATNKIKELITISFAEENPFSALEDYVTIENVEVEKNSVSFDLQTLNLSKALYTLSEAKEIKVDTLINDLINVAEPIKYSLELPIEKNNDKFEIIPTTDFADAILGRLQTEYYKILEEVIENEKNT